MLLPCTVYRITHTHSHKTHTHTHSRWCTILFTHHWNIVALVPGSWIGDHVIVHPQTPVITRPLHWQWGSFSSYVCVSVSENMPVMTLNVYCSCVWRWKLNRVELYRSCCYAVNVSDLGCSHNGFHECSVAKLSKSLSVVLFHGGATLVVYIDCQLALPNYVIS